MIFKPSVFINRRFFYFIGEHMKYVTEVFPIGMLLSCTAYIHRSWNTSFHLALLGISYRKYSVRTFHVLTTAETHRSFLTELTVTFARYLIIIKYFVRSLRNSPLLKPNGFHYFPAVNFSYILNNSATISLSVILLLNPYADITALSFS